MYKIEPYPTNAADSVARAITSVLLDVASMLQTSFARYSEHRRERSALRELQPLPDRLLRDIGLTRHDIDGTLPLGRFRREQA